MNRIIDTIQSYYGIDDIAAKVRKYPYPSAKMAAILLLFDAGCNGHEIAKLVGLKVSDVLHKYEEADRELIESNHFKIEYKEMRQLLKDDQ